MLCAPALLAPKLAPSLTTVAAIIIPLLWLARWRARGRLTTRTRLDLPILGLMLMAPVGVLVSMDPDLSLPKAAGLLLGVAMYYAVLNQEGSFRLLDAVPPLSWLVLVLALFGVDWIALKIPLLAPVYEHLPRLIRGVPRTMKGGFHPNEVGGTLAMLIPLLVAWWSGRPATFAAPSGQSKLWHWYGRIFHSKIFAALTIIACALELLLTQSRSAIVAAAIALLVMTALQSHLGLLLVALGSGGITLVIWRLGVANVMERVLALPGSYTWLGRPEIWANALRTLGDFPLTGIGLNVFAPASRVRYAYLIARPPWDFVHAHNILMQVGVDLGVVGLACFVALVGVLVIMTVRALRGAEAVASKGLICGLAATVAAYLVFGTIDAITLGAKPSLLFWLAAGLISRFAAHRPALARRTRAERVEKALVVAIPLLLITSLAVSTPLRSLALSNMGQLSMVRGSPDASIPLLQRALEENSGNRRAHLALAQAYAYIGRDEDALSIWRAAGYAPINVSDKGEALRLEGSPAEAERWQQLALSLDPRLGDAWYRLALAYEDQERHDAAGGAIEQALDVDRFVSLQSSEVIRYYLRTTLANQPAESGRAQGSDSAVDAANSLVDQGKIPEAMEMLEQVLRADKLNADAWVIVGKAQSRQRNWDQAILAFEKSLSIESTGYWANHLLASLYATRKEWSNVAGLALVAAQVAPSGELRASSVLLLLEAYEELGDWEEACALLERIRSWAEGSDLVDRLGAAWNCGP